ncbi:class I glutamine amidotransferase-like protein [Periconia macrospinosa]|uniref:D-lactate dehydratase n=1 Tax=Periconia macrospinosa TaxID=97972 RepID=A0A2V1E3I7_9PLEO|nr:class I glutamine amidotransferase-like protein [Periconia macrospinosa]
MAPPRRVLIAVPSTHAPLYDEEEETGLFIIEALHPFIVFSSEGFEVDFVSETGEWFPDYLSTATKYLNPIDRHLYENAENGFRIRLSSIEEPSSVNPSDYGIFFASSGRAALIDYPKASGLQSLASSIYYGKQGILSAVSHGGVLFRGIKGTESRKSVITEKMVTGFPMEGEEEEGVLEKITKLGVKTLPESFSEVDAMYLPPYAPFELFTVEDERIVTGANPASARATALKAVEIFERLT